MPSISKRKVYDDDRRISLPKGYCDYHGIEKGDSIQMLFNGVIVIMPEDKELSPAKEKALKELLE